MKINFTITGNQEDASGNAIPKIKKTRASYWTPEAQRYAKWKIYVQNAYAEAISFSKIAKEVFGDRIRIIKSPTIGNKPIDIKSNARMDIKIYWKNKAHADPENVFGSIADALFVQDRNLDGSFTGELAADGKGRVEVSILIADEAPTFS